MRVSALALGFVAAFGCGDDWVNCTLELRTAVTVTVTAPPSLRIDKVTARRAGVDECEAFGGDLDAGRYPTYHCHEQGGGTYVVTVHSGSLTWTDSVSVPADECHTTENKELHFVLDPETAD